MHTLCLRRFLPAMVALISLSLLLSMGFLLPAATAQAAQPLLTAPGSISVVPRLHGVKTAGGFIYPDMAMAGNGEQIALVWTDYVTQTGGGYSANVYTQFFNSRGLTLTAPITVATGLVYEEALPIEVDAAMQPSGEVVIVYDHLPHDAGLPDIGMQLITPSHIFTDSIHVLGASNRNDVRPVVRYIADQRPMIVFEQRKVTLPSSSRFNYMVWTNASGSSSTNTSISSTGSIWPALAANADGYAVIMGTTATGLSARIVGSNGTLSAAAVKSHPFSTTPDLTTIPGLAGPNAWRLATFQGSAQDPLLQVFPMSMGANANVAPSSSTTASITVSGVYSGAGPKILVDPFDRTFLAYQTGATPDARALVVSRFNSGGTLDQSITLLNGASVTPIFAVALGQPNSGVSGSNTAAVVREEFDAGPGDLVDFNVQLFAPLLAVDDAASVNEDSTLTATVAANDGFSSDPSAPVFSVMSGPSHGSLSFAVNGSYTYTPVADFHGDDTFHYQITDAFDFTSTASVNIAVLSQPDPLSVTRSGNGSGRVTGTQIATNTLEIDCGATCSVLLPDSAVITLTAGPAFGSSFSGWTGVCSGTNDCVVSMDPARAVDAAFTLNPYGISVSAVGSGQVSQAQAEYDFGASIVLTATPATGWSFAGWSGDSSSQVSPLTVVVTATNSYTAHFTLNDYPVAVSVQGNGNAEKSPDQAEYAFGASIALTATPATGWNFVGWNGDSNSQDNPLSVIVTTTNTYTANFTPTPYPVDVSVVGSGNVQKSPDQAEYDFGASTVLTATAATGWSFAGWSGDSSSQENPLSVVVTMTNSYTANFTLNNYPVAVSAQGNGNVEKSPDQAEYAFGASVVLTATPAKGWSFAGWGGDSSSPDNPLSVVVTTTNNYIAGFTLNTYPVEVSMVGNGSVQKSLNQAEYGFGESVTLTATPATGWSFAGWSGDSSSLDNLLTVVVTLTNSYTASFSPNPYPVDVSVVGSGNVQKSPEQAEYIFGESVTLTAIPATGWSFVGWSGDSSSQENPLSVVVTMTQSYTANFARNGYAVPVSVVGSGNVQKSTDQAEYGFGESITLTAIPATGWSFAGWSGDRSSLDNPLTVVVTTTNGYTANFVTNTYPVDVSVVGNGNVQRSPDQAEYAFGSQVTLTAVTANTEWAFVKWTSDGVVSLGSALSITVGLDNQLQANFRELGAPLLINDAFATNQVVTIHGNLLVNDTDPEGGTLRVTGAISALHGLAQVEDNGDFSYTPNIDFMGFEVITYTVSNDAGRSASAQAIVIVEETPTELSAPSVMMPDRNQPTTYTVAESGITLTFVLPAGYLGLDLAPQDTFYYVLTPLSITELPGNSPSLKIAGLHFRLDAFLNATKISRPTFDTPLRFTINYPEAMLSGGIENQISLQYWDAEENAWSEAGATLVERNLETNQLVFDIAHLSEFALFVLAPTALEEVQQPSRYQIFLPRLKQ